MKVFTLLATAVLLAACVHDTDDFTLLVADRGTSLIYYIGSPPGGKSAHDDPWDTICQLYSVDGMPGRKSAHDDPWDTITDKYSTDSVHGGKSGGAEDPWDTITDTYGGESVHTGKSGEPDDPWDTINATYSEGSVHTNKPKHGGAQPDLRPEMRSSAVFLTFTPAEPAARLAFVEEVRGRVLKLCYSDGSIQFVVDAPERWVVGSWLEVDFYFTGSKHKLPLLGVCTWRSW